MSMADYRACDVCGGKAFYDASLHYPEEGEQTESPNVPMGAGAIKVLCRKCAKTHTLVVIEKSKTDGGK
jgi:hypothetical protein